LESKADEIFESIIKSAVFTDESKIKSDEKNELLEILAIRAAGEEKGIVYEKNTSFDEYRQSVFKAIIKEIQ